MKRFGYYLIVGSLLLASHAWSSESTLRVAFVYNFIKFIEWPDSSEQQSIRLCALGADAEVHLALAQIKGKEANKQVIELLYLDDEKAVEASLNSCQMVYRPLKSSIKSFPHPLPQGTLLVADEAKPNEPDVGISLLRNDEGRIEFSINRQVIAQSGVTVSSQLLKLAKNTREDK
jgi:hypothetical protein